MKTIICLLLSCLSVSTVWAGERILALSPHACEMLYAIDAGDEVVGISEYCDYPEAVKDKPVIANYSRLYSEAALRLQPTLVIASNAALQGLDMLKQHGARIVVTHPETLQDIFDDLHRLGEQTGHRPQAVALVDRLQKQLADIKKQTTKRQSVFFEVWSDPLMTEAGSSFITQVLHAAGGDNLFSANKVETMRVNVEAVVRANPEVIIIPNRGDNIETRTAFWKQWLPTARIIAINPDLISRPSPRIIDGVAHLQQRLSLAP